MEQNRSSDNPRGMTAWQWAQAVFAVLGFLAMFAWTVFYCATGAP